MRGASNCHAGISRSEISGTQEGRSITGQVGALGPGSRAYARGRDDSECGVPQTVMPEFREAKYPAPRRAEASPDRLGPWVPALGLTPEAGMTTNAAYLTLLCRNFAKRNIRHPGGQKHHRTGWGPRSRLSGLRPRPG